MRRYLCARGDAARARADLRSASERGLIEYLPLNQALANFAKAMRPEERLIVLRCGSGSRDRARKTNSPQTVPE